MARRPRGFRCCCLLLSLIFGVIIVDVGVNAVGSPSNMSTSGSTRLSKSVTSMSSGVAIRAWNFVWAVYCSRRTA